MKLSKTTEAELKASTEAACKTIKNIYVNETYKVFVVYLPKVRKQEWSNLTFRINVVRFIVDNLHISLAMATTCYNVVRRKAEEQEMPGVELLIRPFDRINS